ncbi:hypothetical protein JOM56_014699, partial [Amanita muscaria]
RIIHTILGHGFTGERRFLLDLPTECPCDTVLTQTRSRILSGCPLYEEHHHLLSAASHDLSPAILLGSFKGLEALVSFIAESNAFH